MQTPFDVSAHLGVSAAGAAPPLLKHATEDLSIAISNFHELSAAFEAYPCLHAMLTDTRRRIFDDCGTGDSGRAPDVGADPSVPCGCSWRSPILDPNGTRIDEAYLRTGGGDVRALRAALARAAAGGAGGAASYRLQARPRR